MSSPWTPSPRTQSALLLGQSPDLSRGAVPASPAVFVSTEVLEPRVARLSSGCRVKPGVWVSLPSCGRRGARLTAARPSRDVIVPQPLGLGVPRLAPPPRSPWQEGTHLWL